MATRTERNTEKVDLRITKSAKKKIEVQAKQAGDSVSAYLRKIVLAAIGK